MHARPCLVVDRSSGVRASARPARAPSGVLRRVRARLGRRTAARGARGRGGRDHPPGLGRVHDRRHGPGRCRRGRLVVFVLRTPGGLVDSTRTIVSRMIAAKHAVVVFVAPSGARAASAGFLLTIAADVAAMAPGTSIGAAHPVSGDGRADRRDHGQEGRLGRGGVRALARRQARPQRRARRAGGDSRARRSPTRRRSTAEPPLVDVVATDVPDLLRQLDGRTVDAVRRRAA